MNKNDTQVTRVVEAFNRKGSITQVEAFERFRIMRLGAIIHKLRRKGWNIDTKLIKPKDTRGNGYAKYILVK